MSSRSRRRQEGSILALTAILLPVLIAFAGLCVDGGEIAAQGRWSQNAADAAALAAAWDIANNGLSLSQATNLGSVLAGENGIPASDLAMSYFKADGTTTAATPGQVAFVQADVTHQFANLFLPIINLDTATVSAHARVAVTPIGKCGLCLLSPNAAPALAITGTSSVNLNSPIDINSSASGATSTTASVYIHSGTLSTTSGGVNLVGTAFVNGGGTVSPAATFGATAVADPLAAVPALDPSLCGTTYTQYAAWDSGNSGIKTIPAGVSGAVACYPSIAIHGSATVTMAAGSYLISGPFTVTNSGTLTANGVFMYFSCNTGVGSPPPAVACTSGAGQAGGSLSITGNSPVTITAPNSGTYQGLAIMADRSNTNANGTVINLGGSGTLSTTGTVYAASGAMTLTGNTVTTTFSSRFVVATVTDSGSSSININYTSSQNYSTPGSLKLTI